MGEFEEFEKLARARGATARDCGNGHWQVRGKLLVNYYPFAKRGPTIFVRGTSYSSQKGGWLIAIEAAFEPPGLGDRELRMTSKEAHRERTRLLRLDSHCMWCRTFLDEKTATLEHVIPLARGGSNRRENLGIACEKCNRERGCDMPELRR